MANKASTEGVDFQRHLCYYLIGLLHNKYDYSIRNEANETTYGALDDVILKVHRNAEGADSHGLYFFQAKQKQDETRTLSIQDVLHERNACIEKYIETYGIYKNSPAHQRDGMPTEMIYWTTCDFHETTGEFLAAHTSSEPHLLLTIHIIKKVRIKHWKALFMFEMAQNLAAHAGSSKKKDNTNPFKYLNESVVEALSGEVLEPVEQTTAAEQQDAPTKVKLRETFLHDAPSLSEHAKQFRVSFIVACKILYTHPRNPTFDITSLKSKIFFTTAFNMGTRKAAMATDGSPVAGVSFSYRGLEEEELDWFFKHFIFYVKIPKGERMLKAVQDLLGDRFDKEMFETHLITEPLKLATLAERDKSQQQQDCLLTKSYVQSVMSMIELKRKLTVQPLKGIDFTKQSIEQLEAKIKSFSDKHPNWRSLAVVSQSKVAWTAVRIRKKFERSLIVSNSADFEQLQDALKTIRNEPTQAQEPSQNVKQDNLFIHSLVNNLIGECAQYIMLLDLPDIAECSKWIVQQLADVKVIEIVHSIAADNAPTFVTDEVERCNVIVDPEKVDIKHVTVDDKKLVLANYIAEDFIDSVKKVEELSTLTDIIVRSDVYEPDERHYIKRDLLEEGGTMITDRASLLASAHTVSIVSGTSGQGKTMELLQIAKLALEETVCLYLRASTIAKGILQAENVASSDGFELLLSLLSITAPTGSRFVLDIVKKCLEQMRTVCLLVDGFDEIVEQYQNAVIKFLLKMLQCKGCRLVIGTRNESVSVLKEAFQNAAHYTLASFSYETYFRQLWLSDASERTPTLEQNVDIFLSNFDALLKGAGWKSFLEVPQLCKIMGTIYQDRIRKPNIQWHTNYEIGSIYDTFVESKFEHTLRGKFDEMDRLHVWASELIRGEYYAKHAQLAYELEYSCCSDLTYCEQLQRFGLILLQCDASKRVNFMHRTVMDYFLVRYCLLEQEVEKAEFHSFLKRYFCVSRANIADKFIDFFLHDPERLSEGKRQIIRSHMDSGILPTCIRMALNNATFNTLRLLLSVAPKRLLAQLCFRFGAASSLQGKKLVANDSNDINLKRLGEKQTMLLLETLRACDEEYADDDYEEAYGYRSILQRMLFEANPDVEDTLEVAIRKPFPDVFDWVVAYCTVHLTVETERYLMGRLPRYVRAIIRHCYAENKERIIDKVVTLCEDTLPSESVRQCLRSFDLLEELIVSIEIVPQGKVFKQKDRLDLTHKILSLLDRYGSKEQLLAAKEQARKTVETLQNAAIKSMLKQWMDMEQSVDVCMCE